MRWFDILLLTCTFISRVICRVFVFVFAIFVILTLADKYEHLLVELPTAQLFLLFHPSVSTQFNLIRNIPRNLDVVSENFGIYFPVSKWSQHSGKAVNLLFTFYYFQISYVLIDFPQLISNSPSLLALFQRQHW